MSPQIMLITPLVFGVSVGAIVWLVLSVAARADIKPRNKECQSCGSSVLDDWRLCPDCGNFIETTDQD